MNKEEIKIDGIPIQDYGTPNSRTCYSSNYTSKEEQEAIEYWKRDIEFYHYNTQLASEHYAQIILNLIDRLQKELEQEKEYNDKLTLIFKEKLNNIVFEVETAWRKFEKLEEENE